MNNNCFTPFVDMIKTKNSYENFNDSGCSMGKFNKVKNDLAAAQENLAQSKKQSEMAKQNLEKAKEKYLDDVEWDNFLAKAGPQSMASPLPFSLASESLLDQADAGGTAFKAEAEVKKNLAKIKELEKEVERMAPLQGKTMAAAKRMENGQARKLEPKINWPTLVIMRVLTQRETRSVLVLIITLKILMTRQVISIVLSLKRLLNF